MAGKKASAADVAALLESHGAVVIDDLLDSVVVDRLRSDLHHRDGIFYGAQGSFAGAHSTRNAGKVNQLTAVCGVIYLFSKKCCRSLSCIKAAGRIRSRTRPRGTSARRRRRPDSVTAVVPTHRSRHVHEHKRRTASRSPHVPSAASGPPPR